METKEQVVQTLRDLGQIHLFSKGIPGSFEVSDAQEVADGQHTWVELEVTLFIQSKPPQPATITIKQAFSFTGGVTPTLDQKWRKWIRPESWTKAKIIGTNDGWVLGRMEREHSSLQSV